VPVDYRGHKFTYNLGVNYKLTRDKLLYAKYSTGFISGGQFSLAFAPEIAKSYEGGIKADWLDGSLRTNLAVYRVKYTNIQGSVNGANLTPPQPLFTNAATNIGDARVSGFELETTYSPIRNLILSGSTGLTDFKFTRIRPELLVGQADYQKLYRPRYTANLSAQYTTDPVYGDAEIVARIDGRWQSKSHGVTTVPLVNNATGFTAAEQYKYAHDSDIPSYWVWNARVALQKIKFGDHEGSVALWSRNLFDNKSPVFVQGLTTVVTTNYEAARTVGVDVEFNF
jgi:iron complex outermembrane receptor protein